MLDSDGSARELSQSPSTAANRAATPGRSSENFSPNIRQLLITRPARRQGPLPEPSAMPMFGHTSESSEEVPPPAPAPQARVPQQQAQRPPAQQGRPRAKGRAAWSAAASRCFKAYCRCSTLAVLSVVGLCFMPGFFFPNAARGAQAFITIGEELGQATSGIAHAGANMTKAMAFVVTALTNQGASLADTAWKGVDLTNVSVKVGAGRLFAGEVETLEDVLFCEAGRNLTGVPTELESIWKPLLKALRSEVPVAQVEHQSFVSQGHWHTLSLWGRSLRSGYSGVAWRVAEVDFTVAWANPLWELAECDTDTEAEQVAALLQALVSTTAPVSVDVELSEAAVAESPVLETGGPRAWWRWLGRWLRRRRRVREDEL